jgi:uncharacterized protein YjdB
MRNRIYFLWAIVSLLSIWSCKDDTKTPIISIHVTPETLHLAKGDRQEVTAEPVPSDADPAEKPFKWESGDTHIATVTSSGLVTAVSAGSTEITVKAQLNANVEKKIPVTVSDTSIPLTAIRVSPETVTLDIDEKRQITATPEPSDATGVSFSWSSSDRNIVAVTTSGLVTGKAGGTATITVKSGGIEKAIPVTVNHPPFIITIGATAYEVDTVECREVAPGVKWFKFRLPEFTNGFGTLGKGLVVNSLEIDLSLPGNKVEVCSASPATLGNVERPTAMYARKKSEYNAAGRKPVAVMNAGYFMMGEVGQTYNYEQGRSWGTEVENGMFIQKAMPGWELSLVIDDNGMPHTGTIGYSATADINGANPFPLTTVNHYADGGELVLFNNMANSYPTDSAFAWSPNNPSIMVPLSGPAGGWKVNERMEFTVIAGTDANVYTVIPAAVPSGGKDFNGEGAILVGNGRLLLPSETSLSFNPAFGKQNITATNQGAYWDLTTTGADPYIFTTALTGSVGTPNAITLTFEYQSTAAINDAQIFYGKPGATGGVSTPENLQLQATGTLDANNAALWHTFTLDLMEAVNTHGWGKIGHTLRLDPGGIAGRHLLIRNIKINLTTDSGGNSAATSREFLENLTEGDVVGSQINLTLDGQPLPGNRPNICGAERYVLQNGHPTNNNWDEAYPRTSAGYSQDGKKIYLLVIDGRQANYSVGATTGQMAYIMKALGAHTAINMDGGGSSCMVVDGEIKNKPSDGSERAVGNGIMVTVNK